MNLFEQLQEKLNGHPYNGYFTALCQFHDDRNPSMFVYEDGYHCATCGARGSLQYLNKYLGGRDVKISESKSILLPRWRKWEEQFGDLDGIAHHAHKSLERYPQWKFYFEERKIEKFIDAGLLGYIDGWVTFPVFDEKKKIQNIVVRHTKRKDIRYAIKKIDDQKPMLYVPNWQRVLQSDVVYVVYGIIDAIGLELLKQPVVTGITGKSLSWDLLRPLEKQFVILPDKWEENDAYKLANRMGWRGEVKKLKFGQDEKDPDDLRVHGKLSEQLGV